MPDIIIDISHHNGTNLNFVAAKSAGIMGVIHKATQGVSGVDPMLATNKAAIRSAGLLFGAYHFGDGSDGGAQAKHFLATAGWVVGDLIALDLEHNPAGPSMTLEQARAFLQVIMASTGNTPVLYGGEYLRELVTGHPDPELVKCPLWLADYRARPEVPPGWATWSLWQYSDGSHPPAPAVPGIGHCDRDRFAGDAPGLAAFWAKPAHQARPHQA